MVKTEERCEDCKNTGEKKMGYVYFKEGSFFIEGVCFPYLTDFKL